jgi:hypothetical protein
MFNRSGDASPACIGVASSQYGRPARQFTTSSRTFQKSFRAPDRHADSKASRRDEETGECNLDQRMANPAPHHEQPIMSISATSKTLTRP